MVNGISGLTSTNGSAGIDQLKAIIQDTVEEVLESKEKQEVALDSQDDENVEINLESQQSVVAEEEDKQNGLVGLLTNLTSMMNNMMQMMMKMMGVGSAEETDKTDGNTETGATNERHVYTKEEQQFLETYEWYVKDLVAEELLTTDPDLAKSLIGSDLSWNEKIAKVSTTVRDEEVEDYLMRNPDAIQDGIKESRSWSKETKALHSNIVKVNTLNGCKKYYR